MAPQTECNQLRLDDLKRYWVAVRAHAVITAFIYRKKCGESDRNTAHDTSTGSTNAIY